ncbi:MAG: hypothetical protein KDB53_18560, partial [Planctomycetes bacterium]|nr:hypothetical protein [Planctomycetota bacterium]
MPVTPPPAIIRIGTIINMPAGVDVTLVVGFGADVPSSYTFQKDTSYLEVTWGKYTSPATFSTVRGELHERGAFVGLKSHRITGEVI